MIKPSRGYFTDEMASRRRAALDAVVRRRQAEAARYEKLAWYCEARVERSATEDGRIAWYLLTEQAWLRVKDAEVGGGW